MHWKAQLVSDPSHPKPDGALRLMCMSDTHGLHGDIPVADLVSCDILLFAGDFTYFGNPEHSESFLQWIKKLPCKKVIIPGNLDLTFDTGMLEHFTPTIVKYSNTKADLEKVKPAFLADLGDVIYLEHESVTIDGLKIFGSPYTPEFMDLGFQILPGQGGARWSTIPVDADVILAHGPPRGVCDKTSTGFSAGCADFAAAVAKSNAALCVFGHIHEAHGTGQINEILCCNVAMMGPAGKLTHKPTIIDLIKQ